MPKKRTSLDGLFTQTTETVSEPVAATSIVRQSVPKDNTKIHTSIYLPERVYEQLRALAFEEHNKMHDYILEGLDLVFKTRGLKPIAELTQKRTS